MTTTTRRSRPLRSMIVLAVIVATLFGVVAGGYFLSDARWTPGLALDLEGGTQIILQPEAEAGESIPSESIDQAVVIIRQRVNGTGVTEAEVSRQGAENIVVALPGDADEETRNLVRQSAQLAFRPVLLVGSGFDPSLLEPPVEPSPGASGEPSTPAEPPVVAPGGDATAQPTAEPNGVDPTAAEPTAAEPTAAEPTAAEPTAAEPTAAEPTAAEPQGRALPRAELAAGATAAAEPTAPAAEPTVPPTAVPGEEPSAGASEAAEPLPAVEPTDASDQAYLTPEVLAEFEALVCIDPTDPAAAVTRVDQGVDEEPLVVCSSEGVEKYVLGPVEVPGENVADAQWGFGTSQTGVSSGQVVVSVEFNGEGTSQFADVSRRLVGLQGDRNRFGIVLDGLVVSAPTIQGVIPNGQAEISGNFTQESAESLANQLRFGALPLSFTVESEESISATLGGEQLRLGVLAGLIGLLLVVVYSLIQYRALGLVTVASLLVAGVITYGVLLLLSWRQGYRLSLPGVAGLIVAIGITADSFIIYFERIRDEIRDGRSLEVAVERGWERSRRTILASDAVSLLSAVTLYILAVGGVRGFAFTLGLTTIIDLAVVFLFTKPLVTLLARTRFFGGGHKLSGFDPEHLGSVVARRAVRSGARPTFGDAGPPTIAERKRAAREANEGAVL